MSRLRLKYFGPIKEGFQENDGWIDIKKVTVFIGNQGSGKSTIAKVISTLTWLEKSINRGDSHKSLTFNEFNKLFEYQRINNYFSKETEIEYDGESIYLKYGPNLVFPIIEIKPSNDYLVPKIMYVPAERNFLSVVKNAFGVRYLPETLFTFAEELRKGQNTLNSSLLELPIGGIKYKYIKENETSYLIGEDYELDLLESSSGYQSLVPLYLVTKFLSDELQKEDSELMKQLSVDQRIRRSDEIDEIMSSNILTDKRKTEKVKEIDSKYLNRCLINVVEEPEQNLFPSSQREILNSLLKFNNRNKGNKLIITTHSPYIINFLSLAIQGEYLKNKIKTSKRKNELMPKLNSVIPEETLVASDDIIFYQMDEGRGIIQKLSTFEGIPSDKNYLNNMLREGNIIFDSLLEIEEEL